MNSEANNFFKYFTTDSNYANLYHYDPETYNDIENYIEINEDVKTSDIWRIFFKKFEDELIKRYTPKDIVKWFHHMILENMIPDEVDEDDIMFDLSSCDILNS